MGVFEPPSGYQGAGYRKCCYNQNPGRIEAFAPVNKPGNPIGMNGANIVEKG